ncbi:MAG TPA: porin [Parvibaculum sp.]|jgi:predicted porin
MKKTLLGTTALVAVGLLAGPALASDPLKVTVGGNVVTGFYAIDADDAGPVSFQDTKVALVARNIDIKAEGTLDNGLVAGVDAKLMLGSDWNTTDNGDATFRQLFAYLEGGFGRFEIGGTDGAAYKMHYTSPWFVPGNGVDSPNILNNAVLGGTPGATGLNLRQSTFSLLATDANKVSYFTPRLAGFQLGLSFSPEVSQHNPYANGLVVLPDVNNVTNVFEAALNYAGTFGGVDLGLDGFYTTGDSSDAGIDPEEYGFGANIGYAGFTLGGAYYKSKDVFGSFASGATAGPIGSSTADVDQKVWTAGLKYATGPWTVGVAYLSSDIDAPLGFSPSSDSWQIGGGYNLGSGVDIGLDLQKSKVDTGAGDYDSQSAGIVLAIAF